MNKLLLILAISFSTPASAQKIHFTDTTNVWNEWMNIWNDFGPALYRYHTYRFMGDTTVGAVSYRMFNFGNVPAFFNSVALVREDTVLNKVYIRDMINDSDVVFMDYGLVPGDTFIINGNGLSGQTPDTANNVFVVAGIDSTMINGIWHRVWEFSGNVNMGGLIAGWWPIGPIYVVEGIGCLHHPTYMLQAFSSGEPPYQKLYCFSNQGIRPTVAPAVQHFDNNNSCVYYPKLFTNRLNVKDNSVMLAPNPAATHITITTPNKITTLTITNLLGQTIYTHNHNSENVEVDVSYLPPGIYVVKINGSEVRKFIKN